MAKKHNFMKYYSQPKQIFTTREPSGFHKTNIIILNQTQNQRKEDPKNKIKKLYKQTNKEIVLVYFLKLVLVTVMTISSSSSLRCLRNSFHALRIIEAGKVN